MLFFILKGSVAPVASQVSLVVKNLPASAGGVSDVGSIRGVPHQYSCLKNTVDQSLAQSVATSQTRLRD